jgi:hypothetical protein
MIIFTKLKNYRKNLEFCYDQIKERGEHLGVADKYLIKQRYNKIIKNESLADKIDCELKQTDISDYDYNSAISRAALQIGCNEEKTTYF